MRRLLFFGMLSFAGTLCRADLLRTFVTGFLGFSGGETNFYDPANGFVPVTGYDNSADSQNSATVQILGGQHEFGFEDDENLDVTGFLDYGFIFTDTSRLSGSNRPITLQFTDIAFFDPTDFREISSTFRGLTYGISGDVITINIPGLVVTAGEVQSAEFHLVPAVPEPDSLILLTTSVLAVGLLVGRKHLRSRSTIES